MNATIAAISTAYGEGGIGIVRISGPLSRDILAGLFHGRTAGAFMDRHMYYGTIREPESAEIVDEVLVVLMEGPHSYTGEDVAEIHCHGSVVSLRKILKLVRESGAELAAPGEFTKRAFLNGRIDLTQAEAVIDVIRAGTDISAKAAQDQLSGGLGSRIRAIRVELADAIAEAIVNMDYPDEDEVPTDNDSAVAAIRARLAHARSGLEAMIATADTGRMIRDGINVVITGRANVGKSSLLNALLRESRAIVTDIPGTTRDSIEEYIELGGIPVKLTDTAGIRKSGNEAERIGVERAGQALEKSDLILFVLDGSSEISRADREVMDMIAGRKAVAVINKCDLPTLLDTAELPTGWIHFRISATTGIGLEALEDYIVRQVYGGELRQASSMLVTNARHQEAMARAVDEITLALDALDAQGTPDFAEMNARTAWELLGEITGETAGEDVLDRVFEKFCVGK